jgi:hypothetical protein
VVSITNKYGIEKSKKRNGLAHSNVPKNEVIEDKKAKERERERVSDKRKKILRLTKNKYILSVYQCLHSIRS